MIIQKLNRLQNNILRLLCIKAGSTISQSEIAKKLKVTSAAVRKALPKLKDEKLINIERIGKIKLLSIELKRVENLKLLYQLNLRLSRIAI
jgi:DNA-binding GntR family transcriptional regulator